jgi:hypothetical protein
LEETLFVGKGLEFVAVTIHGYIKINMVLGNDTARTL